MRRYRAYILGIDGFRFVWANEFKTDHPDDAAALSAAKALSEKHEIEVWEDGRLVARLSPREEASSESIPSMFALSFDCAKSPAASAEPVSESRISELATAASPGDKAFVPEKMIE